MSNIEVSGRYESPCNSNYPTALPAGKFSPDPSHKQSCFGFQHLLENSLLTVVTDLGGYILLQQNLIVLVDICV